MHHLILTPLRPTRLPSTFPYTTLFRSNSSTTNSTTGGSGWRMAHAEMFFMNPRLLQDAGCAAAGVLKGGKSKRLNTSQVAMYDAFFCVVNKLKKKITYNLCKTTRKLDR